MPSHLLADSYVAVCSEDVMGLADSSCDNPSGLFQVWYMRALSIKLTTCKHITVSGKAYMDFGTAIEIIVVIMGAYGSSRSNIQIMLRVCSMFLSIRECPSKNGQHTCSTRK